MTTRSSDNIYYSEDLKKKLLIVFIKCPCLQSKGGNLRHSTGILTILSLAILT